MKRLIEENVLSFRTDFDQIRQLEEARKIHLKSGKKENVVRLVEIALKQAVAYENPVSEARFLDFAIRSYREIGEQEKADVLNARAKDLRKHLRNCLIWGVEPKYSQ